MVVGGGAAGLAAALTLGRSRRSVLVVDAGEPRHAPAAHVHSYLGHEGTPPTELYAAGRAEVTAYGVEVVDDRVVDVCAAGSHETSFVVTTRAGREALARRVVVATGLVDELPELPGLRERWGRDVLHCPYCHGYEVRDQRVGVLATSAMATHQALLFRQLTTEVTVVLHDGAVVDEEQREQLRARGVRVVEERATEVVVEDDRLTGLRLASGEVVGLDALVVSTRMHVRADFLASVGLEPVEAQAGGHVWGTVLPADASGATPVTGVYAAGNATDVGAQVVGAAAAGTRVGAMVDADLVAEEAGAAVAASRAEIFERSAWDRRYAEHDHVWSGRVNPALEAEAADLTPGRALDVGSGEGGDAVWLAQRGWQVTGLEFSGVGRERAAVAAEQQGATDRVEWRDADIRHWQPGGERWDLVTSQFLHLPSGGMTRAVATMCAALAPGGTLLVAGHHPDDLHTHVRRPSGDVLFTPDDLVAALSDDVEVVVAEKRTRAATGPDGEDVTVSDSVVRARRR